MAQIALCGCEPKYGALACLVSLVVRRAWKGFPGSVVVKTGLWARAGGRAALPGLTHPRRSREIKALAHCSAECKYVGRMSR